MKKIGCIAALILALIGNTAWAGTRDGGEDVSTVKRKISRAIGYPDLERGKVTSGVVYISFTYDEAGRVEVLECSASDPAFQQHVIDKLNNLDLAKDKANIGKVFHYRFLFRAED